MMAPSMVVDVSEDWAIACDVQQRFMQRPKPTISDGISYSAHCQQMRAVGGDFYEVLPLCGNRVALAIGDASGKSLPAALMISSVQSSLRTAAHFAGEKAAVVLQTVNRLAEPISLAGRYATVFYGVFDGTTRMLRYVNAGHNPPVIIGRDGSVTRLETGGAPVGMFSECEYEEGTAWLRPGDLLVAYTDGVTEAVNAEGDEWGLEGLLKAIDKREGASPDEIARSIFAQMAEFSEGHQTDDATVLVARAL